MTDIVSQASKAKEPLLVLRGITKSFPGVIANDHVDLDIYGGEVHVLLGENGAGKSTLMKILYGFYRADSGQILLNGEPISIRSPRVSTWPFSTTAAAVWNGSRRDGG